MYAEDLVNFPLADVEAVCLEIGRSVRAEGETAFPPIAVLEARLVARATERAVQARAEAERSERAEWEAHRKAHPEEYEDTPEMLAQIERLNAKLAMPRARAVPRYGQEGGKARVGTPWERLGMTEEAYDADCERRRALIAAQAAEVAA